MSGASTNIHELDQLNGSLTECGDTILTEISYSYLVFLIYYYRDHKQNHQGKYGSNCFPRKRIWNVLMKPDALADNVYIYCAVAEERVVHFLSITWSNNWVANGYY